VTRLLTPQQVAARLQVPTSRVYAAARRGELPSLKLGKYRRFDEATLEAWIARQLDGGGDA
jgi:excisionase family DNA binding protein